MRYLSILQYRFIIISIHIDVRSRSSHSNRMKYFDIVRFSSQEGKKPNLDRPRNQTLFVLERIFKIICTPWFTRGLVRHWKPLYNRFPSYFYIASVCGRRRNLCYGTKLRENSSKPYKIGISSSCMLTLQDSLVVSLYIYYGWGGAAEEIPRFQTVLFISSSLYYLCGARIRVHTYVVCASKYIFSSLYRFCMYIHLSIHLYNNFNANVGAGFCNYFIAVPT